MDAVTRERILRFGRMMDRLHRLYEEYAGQLGHTYDSLYTLYFIFSRGDCTQTDICGQLCLPKQTVHSIIMSFLQQGYVDMIPGEKDKRQKMIRLTPEGRDYADKILLKITEAEMRGMERLGEKEAERMLQCIEQYVSSFTRKFQKKDLRELSL